MKPIEVTNLRLKFPKESAFIFKDFSFSVLPGEKVLFLGPSGCGKSTLLQVLSGIIPDSIEVPLKYDAIRRPDSWGFVFQDPDTQFCMPYVDEELAFVLENLSVPRNEMDVRIKEVLATVGLQGLPIRTPIHDLSQGMKQRLALASILLLQPDILFLDEPSALLDPDGVFQIWKAVKEIAANKTVIIVEHKIDYIVDWVDRVVLFNHEGEVIADDVPEVIFLRHRQALIEYGIWYPHVWDDYLASPDYAKIVYGRAERVKQHEPLLYLEQFSGYRGRVEKIHIPKAHIKPGSWISILGENGAGKSTFLLSLMQLLRTTGQFKVEGKMIEWKKRNHTLPRELTLVFQNPELQFVANSIHDELAFSSKLKGKTDIDVRRWLQIFQLPMNEMRHPYQLSIGQKRRLSVATAFTTGAKILLLDEPTFGQDARNTFMMLEQLEHLRKEGIAIVMVTHDLKIAENFATEVWTIDNGNLVEMREKESAYAGTIHST